VIHEVARPFQLGTVTMGLVAHQGLDPLAVDVGGPSAANDVHRGQLQQQIADRGRVKHIGVEKGRVLRHGRW